MSYVNVRDTIEELNHRIAGDTDLHEKMLTFSKLVPSAFRQEVLNHTMRLATLSEETTNLRDRLASQERVQ